MRIAYVSHTRFPTEKAHGHQIARVCEALMQLKHDVILLAPDVRNTVHAPPEKYYHLSSIFPVVLLPSFDALSAPWIPGALAFLVTARSYAAALARYFQEHHYDLLYTRSRHMLPVLLATRMPVLLELHTLPKYGRRRFVRNCNRCKRVVCLTTPMRDALVAMGVNSKRVIVAGDAVDLERFAKLPQARSAKHHFNLPDDVPVIGYVGSLVTMDNVQKGADLLLQAALHLRKTDHRVFVFMVGGPAEWADRYRKSALQSGLTENAFRFHGHISNKLVPDAMAACDVLVYPAPAKKHPYFLRDTSPLKLFEYLASGRPVVCADIPPIRDIVDKTTVRFFHPGSATSLAGAVRDVLDHPGDATLRSTKGRSLVGQHTWIKRMERILTSL